MQPIAISVKEAAEALSLDRTFIYALINEVQLETIKVGRRRLVKTESLRRFVESNS